jgi:DnaJ family protein C protein 11
MTYRTGEWSLFGWGGDVSQKMDRSSVSLGMAGMNKHGNYSGEIQVNVYLIYQKKKKANHVKE